LDPLRIATVPGTTLDAVIRDRPEEKELSLESLQKMLPDAHQQRDNNKTDTAFNAYAVATTRRNPANGLVEAAWENYTHIDNPDTGPTRRAIYDNHGGSNDKNECNNDLNTGAKEPRVSSNSFLLARVPQESTSAATQVITEIIMNAQLGDMHAQNALGEMYKDGRGVHQDYEAAMDWYLKAAEQGLASAQVNVGDMYDYGRGVPQDFTKAMEWFRKAAAQDYAPAQCSIGQLNCVPQDYSIVMAWYLKAADQENTAAQNNIGWLYQIGLGDPQDYTKVMYWYQEAAKQARTQGYTFYVIPLSSVGWMYDHGLAVTKDFVEALGWYRKVVNNGYSDAKEGVSRLEKQPNSGGAQEEFFLFK
ncbi:hypothetical protein BGZ95_008458, partial [Linnemannia exigua]